MADTSYQPKVYHKQGGNELVVASGGVITVETGGAISVADDNGVLAPKVVHCVRRRCTIAEVNAGVTLLAAIPGYKYRMVDCIAIAIGGAVGTLTTVDVLGTQSSGVKLVAYAQASLTRSTVLRPGVSGATVLADGASFAACDANTAITVGKTGGTGDTATHVDIIFSYTIET